MKTLKKTAAGTLFGGALLIGGGIGLAHAAPSAPEAQVNGDGLVNITVTANGQQIGVIQDVTLANGVSLATAVCPTSMIDIAALTNLDLNDTAPVNACNSITGGLSYVVSQNGGGNSENAPGQNGDRGNSEYAPGQTKTPEPGMPPSATPPSTPPGQVGR